MQTIEWDQDQARPQPTESPEQIDAKVQDISSQIHTVIDFEKEKNKSLEGKKVEVLKGTALEKDMKGMHNYVKPSLRDIESSKESKQAQKTQ